MADLYMNLQVLQTPRQPIPQMSQTHQVAIAPKPTGQDMSSGGGELIDSMSVSDSGASQLCRRKSKVSL